MSGPEPTHTQYAPAVLRVEPHALPTVQAAFAQALDLLRPHIQLMRYEAIMTEDWLGDEDSARLRRFYNEQVMAAPDGPFSALVKYADLLQGVHDQLAAAEAEYRRVEGDNSALWGAGMSDRPWFAGTYREIATKVRAGSGPVAGDRAQAMWSQAKNVLVQCDIVINRAMASIGSAWSGQAAESFQSAMQPVSTWVNAAADDADATTVTVIEQGSAAGELRRLLPPEPGSHNPYGIGVQIKFATEDAQRLAFAYAGHTADSLRKLDRWSSPPTVTVDVPVPGSAAGAAGIAAAGVGVSGPGGSGAAPGGAGPTPGAVGGFVPVPAVPPGAAGSRPGDTTAAGSGVGGTPGAGTGVGGGAPGAAGGSPGAGGGTGAGGGAPGGAGPGGGTDASGEAGVGTGVRGGPGTGPGVGGGGGTARGGPGAGAGTGVGREDGVVLGGRAGGAGGAGDGAFGVPGRGGTGLGSGDVADGVPAGRGGAGESGRVIGGYGGVDNLPPGAGGRGVRPPVPGSAPPPAGPTWRDLVAAQPPVEQAGARGGTGPLYPPPMVGGGGGSLERGHRRARFLVDDSGLFTDDRWFPPAVIGPEP